MPCRSTRQPPRGPAWPPAIQAAIEAAVADGRLENLLVTVAGTQVSIEYAQPSGAAGDDEDGVAFLGKLNRFTASTPLLVTASGPGLLDGWIDFNRNFLFDATEQVFSSVPVLEGQNYLTVTTPGWAESGNDLRPVPHQPRRPIADLGPGDRRRSGRLSRPDPARLASDRDQRRRSGQALHDRRGSAVRRTILPPRSGATTSPSRATRSSSAVLVDAPRYARPGSFRLNVDGTFDYQPVQDYNINGSQYDTFTYRAVDNAGLTSNLATVTITVNPTK